ncbi:MAG TPA: RNA polymerase factor sigma-54 [Candidatus Polarisedimenticolia bacterium]|jgi:RNA polymerase sigma-54 factor|nr:RNA polymerase factor sigma-54 [Candidatus Polarisedimenticolia bacterium]
MALEQKLHLRLSQKLIMTPSLQQAIKLLQMTKLELQEEITQELTENPLLEEALEGQAEGERAEGEEASPESHEGDGPAPEAAAGPEPPPGEAPAPEGEREKEKDSFDEIDYESYFQDYMDLSYRPQAPSEEFEPRPLDAVLSKPQSLTDHLLWQLDMSPLPPGRKEIAQAIIGNLDDAGMLQASLEEVAAMGPYPIEEVELALHHVQELDPPGIAARDVRECLLLQIAFHDMEGTPAETIVRDHFDLLQGRKFRDLAQAMGLTLDETMEAVESIRHLDPKPGKKYNSQAGAYVVPDVYVLKIDRGYTIVLNEEGLPRLRISPFYRRLIDRNNPEATPETREYAREKFRSAFRLIKSLEERQRTIYKVAKSIVKHQEGFLDYGFEHMRPLILRDVADDIGMHESTVSRVVNHKYMHTPRGLFEMRFFFHSGLVSDSGADISSLTVKEKIKKAVAEEDAGHPLSDAAIVQILGREGLRIARRTIAKYREELRIPSSNERRQGFR